MATTRNESRLLHLDSLRGLAIIMVVATHALGYSTLPPERTTATASVIQLIAVPVFFFVDGLLFFLRRRTNTGFAYWTYVARSSQRLLIPWIIFTAGYTGLRWGAELLHLLPDTLVMDAGVGGLLRAIYLSAISSQMYFLLSLFVLRLFAWFFFLLAGQSLWFRLAATFGYIFAFHTVDFGQFFFDGLDPLYHALWGLQFYLLGLLLPSLPTLFYGQNLLLFSTGLLASVGPSIFHWSTTWPSQMAALVTVYLIFCSFGSVFSPLVYLGAQSMGIYLLHIPLVMKALAILLSGFVNSSTWSYLLALTLTTTLTSLGLTQLLLLIPHGHIALGNPPPIRRVTPSV